MKFYYSYFKLKFISGLQYRTAAIAGISTQIFFGLIFIMVYVAFYSSNSTDLSFNLQQAVTYVWLCQCFFALVNMFYKDTEIFDMIRKGDIAYELIRPKKLYFVWFSKIIGQRLAMVSLRCIPVIIISLLLPKPYSLSLPVSFSSFLLFIVTLIIGALLMTSIITLYHVITLNTLNEKGITNIFVVVADLLSGLVVPIPLFPRFLQIISDYLPFRYISDLPFRIYSGNIGISEGLVGILIQIIWIVIITIVGYMLTNKSLKRVVVQGG